MRQLSNVKNLKLKHSLIAFLLILAIISLEIGVLTSKSKLETIQNKIKRRAQTVSRIEAQNSKPDTKALVFSSRKTTERLSTERFIINQEPTKPASAIVLLSYYRAGSSLVGQLLNHHPKVFYLYEPLKLITDGCNYKKSERLTQLQYVMDCELTGLSISHNPKVNKETMQGGIIVRYASNRNF